MEPRADQPGEGGAERPEAPSEPTLAFDPVEEAHRLRAREAAAGIPGLAGFALVVTDGPLAGAHWLLADGRSEAGRNVEAALCLDDITVSRHHAAFTSEGGRLRVEDLGSTNGTYVNGKRVEHAELASGDEVIIGRFHLVVARGA